MSVNKFKVGDRVRIRQGLTNSDLYRCTRIHRAVDLFGDKILTIKEVKSGYYVVEETHWVWDDRVLESAEKALDNLCVGDLVESDHRKRKVLAALDGCYLLSYVIDHESADSWYTTEDLRSDGFEFVDPEVKPIEIDGKRYDEAEVKKVIKDLEPIE